MRFREISWNSGQIWLKFVENQPKNQQNFAALQKLANFERFLIFYPKFPNVQVALFLDCVDLVKRFPTHIWLWKSDLTQRRTSRLKFEGGGFSAPVISGDVHEFWPCWSGTASSARPRAILLAAVERMEFAYTNGPSRTGHTEMIWFTK